MINPTKEQLTELRKPCKECKGKGKLIDSDAKIETKTDRIFPKLIICKSCSGTGKSSISIPIELKECEFPKEYIKKGKFKLHSGQISNILYDVNAMLTDYKEWIKIREAIPKHFSNYVGIATGGAIIVSQLNTYKNWLMIKDGELKGDFSYHKDYCLIDDVCTTEASIKEAIKIIGKKPKEIFVVMDRREKKTLDIISLYGTRQVSKYQVGDVIEVYNCKNCGCPKFYCHYDNGSGKCMVCDNCKKLSTGYLCKKCFNTVKGARVYRTRSYYDQHK